MDTQTELPYPKTVGMAQRYYEFGYWSEEQFEAWRTAQHRGAKRRFEHYCARYPNWGAMWAKTCAEKPDYCPDGVPSGYGIPTKDLQQPNPWSTVGWILLSLAVLLAIFALGWLLQGLYLPKRDF
jgi:hypothetical protein